LRYLSRDPRENTEEMGTKAGNCWHGNDGRVGGGKLTERGSVTGEGTKDCPQRGGDAEGLWSKKQRSVLG